MRLKIIRNFLDVNQCQELLKNAHKLKDPLPPENPTIFSTKDQSHYSDYFLASKDKINSFYEEDGHTVNKIGHRISESSYFYEISHSKKLKDQLKTTFSIDSPEIVQSMLIFKSPRLGGEVSIHQDQTYLYCEEEAIIGAWFALEKADTENGCLWAKEGDFKLAERLETNNKKFSMKSFYSKKEWEEFPSIPIEMDVGDLLLFDGLVPHFSYKNNSNRSRLSYVMHIKDKSWTYAKSNWNYCTNYPAL